MALVSAYHARQKALRENSVLEFREVPRYLFHGTSAEKFDHFVIPEYGPLGEIKEGGVFFTDNFQVANKYSQYGSAYSDATPRVVRANLPTLDKVPYYQAYHWKDAPTMLEKAKSLGYEAVYIDPLGHEPFFLVADAGLIDIVNHNMAT